MTEIEALEMMKKEVNTTDSKTAMLLQFGINALEEKLAHKTLSEQRQDIYNRVCSELCEKKKMASNKYELMEICETCPLLDLEK
ncbi:MAG: hypothetical protein MJZ34_13425 [Paludibacteraceae bacterium]|nr:hypothetical protein [Paludibacteraceae bacterium]